MKPQPFSIINQWVCNWRGTAVAAIAYSAASRGYDWREA
jgi:hypothetical protein